MWHKSLGLTSDDCFIRIDVRAPSAPARRTIRSGRQCGCSSWTHWRIGLVGTDPGETCPLYLFGFSPVRSRISFRATRWRTVRYESGVSRSESDLEKKTTKTNTTSRRLGNRNSPQITTRVTRSCLHNSSSRPQSLYTMYRPRLSKRPRRPSFSISYATSILGGGEPNV